MASDEGVLASDGNEESWQSKVQSLDEAISYVYHSHEFSDATYITRGKSYQIHTSFLKAMSPYFRNNFSNVTDTICDDCSPIGFEILLRYIYLNNLDTTDKKEILEAYEVAKKFEVEPMIEECNSLISEWDISSSNVCFTLNKAIDVDFLKKRCLEYIKENSTAVLKSEGFLKLRKEALLNILENNCFSTINNIVVIERVLEWSLKTLFKDLTMSNASDDEWIKVRKLLLECKIMGKLKFHDLMAEEITSIFISFPELLKDKESMQFIAYAQYNNSGKNSFVKCKLPEWYEL